MATKNRRYFGQTIYLRLVVNSIFPLNCNWTTEYVEGSIYKADQLNTSRCEKSQLGRSQQHIGMQKVVLFTIV